LVRVVDLTTAIPNGAGNFTGIDIYHSLSGSAAVFHGRGSNGQDGVYTASTSGGTLSRVADLNTATPGGGGNFTTFTNFSISGTTVGFRGVGGGTYQGVFTATAEGGSLAAVADTNTAIPNGTGNFTAFGFQSVSGTRMAFRGAGSNGQNGIYVGTVGGGPLVRVADTNTPTPEGSGNFSNFLSSMTFSGNSVDFQGVDGNGKRGIYLGSTTGGPLSKVVKAGDVLNGRTGGDAVAVGTTGLDNSVLGFSVHFTDNTEAVYTFTPVSEPHTGLAAAAAAVGLLGLGRWLLGGF
jgi:hypothetical protein